MGRRGGEGRHLATVSRLGLDGEVSWPRSQKSPTEFTVGDISTNANTESRGDGFFLQKQCDRRRQT